MKQCSLIEGQLNLSKLPQKEVKDDSPRFYSFLYLVEKAVRGWRPVNSVFPEMKDYPLQFVQLPVLVEIG